MEWIIFAALFIVLLFFAFHQRKELKALEEDLAAQRDRLATQANKLASQDSMLTSHQEALDNIRYYLDPDTREIPGSGTDTSEEMIFLRKRQEMDEEKRHFQEEVRKKAKTLEWYEKEFSIGLDALLELFLHIPLTVRESIIAKMPDSIVKKGFKRLSEKGRST
jgi:hypothetical protein